MNIQNDYRASVDRHRVPYGLLTETKGKMEQEAKQSKANRIRWIVTIPVCCLAAVFSASALVYTYISYKFPKPHFQPAITESVPSEIMQKAGNDVSQTIDKDDLVITIKKTACDKNTMLIALDVQSKNGAPLQEISEYKQSVLCRDTFAEAALLVSGQQYTCYLLRSDDGSALDKASYECSIPEFTCQNGTDAALVLKNFTDDVESAEDAGFLFSNLGVLYQSMTPEKTENFIETGLYGVYADKSLIAKSWTIPAGKNHIAFSSQFPNSYIDNIGFHKTGEYGCQQDVFYISITPGNQEDADGLKRLCFQNLNSYSIFPGFDLLGNGIEDSGFASHDDLMQAIQADRDKKLQMNGGRIVIGLNVSYDANESKDCTVEDLYRYRLVKNLTYNSVTRFSGEWKIPFKIQYQDTTREFNLNYTITSGNNSMTFKKVSLSDLSISYSGTSKISEKMPMHIKLIKTDGTVVDAGNKIGGGCSENGAFEFEGNFETLVNADDIVALELWGQRIPLK